MQSADQAKPAFPLLVALLLTALSELSLLAVFVFFAEPDRTDSAWDLAFFAVPLLFVAVTGTLILRWTLRALRDEPDPP